MPLSDNYLRLNKILVKRALGNSRKAFYSIKIHHCEGYQLKIWRALNDIASIKWWQHSWWSAVIATESNNYFASIGFLIGNASNSNQMDHPPINNPILLCMSWKKWQVQKLKTSLKILISRISTGRDDVLSKGII